MSKVNKKEVKKQLRALGIKIFKDTKGANFVQKGDVKKALSSLSKKK